MPDVLKDFGYATHAIGKYDVGFIQAGCSPTERGFDTFLGYYSACTGDYWYHSGPEGGMSQDKCGGVDFSQSTVEGGIRGAPMSGPDSLNNTYDQEVFTTRAMQIVADHDPETPMFMYMGQHVVHAACPSSDVDDERKLQAPCGTVDLYPDTQLDGWKVQAAMTTQLDYGVGNLTNALKAKGMWNDTVFVFV